MDHNTDRRLRALHVLLPVVLAFAAGVLAERWGFLPGGGAPPAGVRNTFAPFWEAWRLVDNYYVDRSAVRPRHMMQGALEGMLVSLGDTGHTTYLTPEEVKRFEEKLAGDLQGIGAQIASRDHRPTIVATLPGSPARAAGLRPGDVLLQVDGKDVSHLSLEQIVSLVRGKEGTEVRLRVLRPGRSDPLDFTITRAHVEVPDVDWRLLPGGVAHVALRQFGKHTDEQLRAALAKARDQGARSLLLDLRGNPGGLRDEAVAVASEFLEDGNVYLQQDAEGNRKAFPVKKGGVATTLPLCLLIDEGTASAAEIVSGAIQDHKRGKLVGTRTFGTGTVLRPFPLSDRSAVLLAVAEWLTPDGRRIWHKGITPDVTVSLPEGVFPQQPGWEQPEQPGHKGPADPQVEKGLQILKEEQR